MCAFAFMWFLGNMRLGKSISRETCVLMYVRGRKDALDTDGCIRPNILVNQRNMYNCTRLWTLCSFCASRTLMEQRMVNMVFSSNSGSNTLVARTFALWHRSLWRELVSYLKVHNKNSKKNNNFKCCVPEILHGSGSSLQGLPESDTEYTLAFQCAQRAATQEGDIGDVSNTKKCLNYKIRAWNV